MRCSRPPGGGSAPSWPPTASGGFRAGDARARGRAVRHQVMFDRESPEHTHGVVGVEATAQVTDDGLFDWRRANARRVTGVDDVVCRLLVGHVLTGSPRYRGGGRRSGVLLLWL